jgi:hypothetical protein
MGSACTPDLVEPTVSVVSTVPEIGDVHPADAPLRVRFDGYLHPNTRWSGAAQVNTGALRHPVTVGYDPVDQSVVITPTVAFRPGLAYTLLVPAEGVVGHDGGLLEEAFRLDFVVGPPAPSRPRMRPRFNDDVAPIFERRCGCHGPSGEIPPELSPEGMTDQPSWRQPNWRVVVPGRPLASYLVVRMLPGYPGITGPTKSLESDEVRTVIDWIAHLPEG